MAAETLNTDQERSIEALSLFYGGWVKTEGGSDNTVNCITAGPQPNWVVFEDGSVVSSDGLKMSAQGLHEAVYGEGAFILPGRDSGE